MTFPGDVGTLSTAPYSNFFYFLKSSNSLNANGYINSSGYRINQGLSTQILMGDGSTILQNQTLNTTDNVTFNSVQVTAIPTINTNATNKLYVDNKVGAIAITSTDNNLLTIVNNNPTFSITPKYTYQITFAGNNTTLSTAQWFIPSTLRSSATTGLQSISSQFIAPINSVITFMGVSRTTSTGNNSIGISVNSAATTNFIFPIASGDIFEQFAVNIPVVAGQSIATSIFSTIAIAGNCLITLLLRGS